MKRTLNVKRTNNREIAKMWEYDFNPSLHGELFVRCNAKGVVKWETTLVFNLEELLQRGNVKIID